MAWLIVSGNDLDAYNAIYSNDNISMKWCNENNDSVICESRNIMKK